MTDDPALALAEHVGSIHPGVSVLGATLAVCDQLGTVTGKELLLAVARARRVVPYRTADGQGSHQEEFWRHGKRHRPAEEGPAAYGTDRHGKLLREIYYEDGACHRDPSQGPAWCGLEDGKHIEAYLTRGKHHRPEEEGPAVTMRDPTTGRLINQEYFSGGRHHRQGGPALVTYAEDGSPLIEIWERHGVMHRDPADGPAVICRCNIETRIEFYVDGRCHRDPADGPARIIRTPAGELVEVGYRVNGEQVRRYRSKCLRRAIRRSVQRLARAARRRITAASFQVEAGVVAIVTLKRRSFSVREVPVPPELMAALDRQFELAARQRSPGIASLHLWPWHRATAWRVIKGVMAQAGVAGRQACPRGLRHAFGVGTLQATIPITLTSLWLGHASLRTTAIYTTACGPKELAFAARFWRTPETARGVYGAHTQTDA